MKREFELLMTGQHFKKIYEKKCEVIMLEYHLCRMDLDTLYYLSMCGQNDTARDIVALNLFSKGHISKCIDDLTRCNLVTTIQDQKDRRCIHLRLTEHAAPIIEKINEIRCQLREKIFAGITEEEKEIAFEVARKICSNINRELSFK